MENIDLATHAPSLLGIGSDLSLTVQKDHLLFRTHAWGITPSNCETKIPNGQLRLNNAELHDATIVVAALNIICSKSIGDAPQCAASGAIQIGRHNIAWHIELNKSWGEIFGDTHFDHASLFRTLVISFPAQH